jgi:hypothetical protein
MIQRLTEALPDLYERDETAWLEAMAELIHEGRCGDLDYQHLAEYLADMARRDRREVESRLAVLILHVLKWTFQPANRSGSRRGTIIAQRQELAGLLSSGVLRNHAEAVLGSAYAKGVERAAAETGLSAAVFPSDCPYTIDQLLEPEILESGN